MLNISTPNCLSFFYASVVVTAAGVLFVGFPSVRPINVNEVVEEHLDGNPSDLVPTFAHSLRCPDYILLARGQSLLSLLYYSHSCEKRSLRNTC